MDYKTWVSHLISKLIFHFNNNKDLVEMKLQFNDRFANALSSYDEALKAKDLLDKLGIKAQLFNHQGRRIWTFESPFPDFVQDSSMPIPWPPEPETVTVLKEDLRLVLFLAQSNKRPQDEEVFNRLLEFFPSIPSKEDENA